MIPTGCALRGTRMFITVSTRATSLSKPSFVPLQILWRLRLSVHATCARPSLSPWFHHPKKIPPSRVQISPPPQRFSVLGWGNTFHTHTKHKIVVLCSYWGLQVKQGTEKGPNLGASQVSPNATLFKNVNFELCVLFLPNSWALSRFLISLQFSCTLCDDKLVFLRLRVAGNLQGSVTKPEGCLG